MHITLERLRAQREARKKLLDHALDEIIRQLKEMGALKIIAFGSYASGKIGRWSDLDLLVVMPPTKSGKEWFKEIYDKVEREVSADILPFTEEELNQKMATSGFVRHALKTGRVVYER
ncbi:MAG: nucleotidyltransferase domain-containing protein [bacterium]